jgi:hypothetical protein
MHMQPARSCASGMFWIEMNDDGSRVRHGSRFGNWFRLTLLFHWDTLAPVFVKSVISRPSGVKK